MHKQLGIKILCELAPVLSRCLFFIKDSAAASTQLESSILPVVQGIRCSLGLFRRLEMATTWWFSSLMCQPRKSFLSTSSLRCLQLSRCSRLMRSLASSVLRTTCASAC